MKKQILTTIFGIIPFLALYFIFMSTNLKTGTSKFHKQSALNSGGSPSAKTGAPGETNCTSCHGGSALDGNSINELVINSGGTDYPAGETVSMTLNLTDNAAKNGFQIVALNSDDEMAGAFTITDNTNTKLVGSGALNRNYVTHTFDGNSLSSWSFDWDTPVEGGDVTFYVATNKTNSSATNAGDLIYLSQHSFTAPDVSSVEEEEITKEKFNISFNSEKNTIVTDFEINNTANISINVVGLDGKSVYFKNANQFAPGQYSEIIILPDFIKTGIYVIILFIDNKPLSKKIYIPKL